MKTPELAVLDTSVIISLPANIDELADAACISAVSVGELAFGLHTGDPLETARREREYRQILEDYDPVAYDSSVAHEYGAIAAAVRAHGRNPRPRTADLMIAATARRLDAAVITRNPDDFAGLEGIVRVVAVGP